MSLNQDITMTKTRASSTSASSVSSVVKLSSAFTLTELLVVIGIIVIVLGMAVAAFNQITGKRSIAMTQNQVAAFLSAARMRAMQGLAGDDAADCGVLFYRDPQTGRSAMSMVWRRSTGSGDPDPIDRYKGWTTGVAYDIGDRVVAMTLDVQGIQTGANAYVPRIMAKTYRCIQATNPSSAANRPPTSGGPDFYNAYWAEVSPGNLQQVQDVDVQLLPVGVGLQVVNEPRGASNPDRYLRTGVVLFDRLGRVDIQTWSIPSESFAGQLLGIGRGQAVPAPALNIRSSVGLVLYDSATFTDQPGATEGDAAFTIPLLSPNPSGYNPDEANEETWLDQNTTLLLVNRASGQLIKGE